MPRWDSTLALALALSLLASPANAAVITLANAYNDFASVTQPGPGTTAGAWSYNWGPISATDNGSGNPYVASTTAMVWDIDHWSRSLGNDPPSLYQAVTYTAPPAVTAPPSPQGKGLFAQINTAAFDSILTWTSDITGTVDVTGFFGRLYGDPGDAGSTLKRSDVAIYQDFGSGSPVLLPSTRLYGDIFWNVTPVTPGTNTDTGNYLPYSLSVAVVPSTTLHFIANQGTDDTAYDGVLMNVEITQALEDQPPAAMPEPTIGALLALSAAALSRRR